MRRATWEHGTLRGYEVCNGGGRNACNECRDANRQRGIELRARKGKPHPTDQVDPIPAIEAVATLRRHGYSCSAISRIAGVPTSVVIRVSHQQVRFLTRETSDRLRDAVDYARAHPEAGKRDPNVDATRTRQQMRSLAAIGWSISWQRSYLGLSGRVGVDEYPRVSKINADAVQWLYDQISGTPGPSKVSIRYAKQQGWHHPLAYDDDGRLIPEAIPNDLTRAAERREDKARLAAEVAALTAQHISTAEIAARLGVSDRTVIRHRAKAAS